MPGNVIKFFSTHVFLIVSRMKPS